MSDIRWLTKTDVNKIDNCAIPSDELQSYFSPIDLDNRKIAGYFEQGRLHCFVSIKSLEIIPAWSLSSITFINKNNWMTIFIKILNFTLASLKTKNISDLYIVTDKRRVKLLQKYKVLELQEIVPVDTVPKYSVHWKLMNYKLSKIPTYIVRIKTGYNHE